MLFGIVRFFLVLYWYGLVSGKVIKDKTSDSSGSSSKYGSQSEIGKLTNTLLDSYNPDVRPVCDGKDVVQTTTDMAIRQIVSLNEPEQTVMLSLWMRFSWEDCHLTWNPDDFNGTKSVVLPIGLIWKPDIAIVESISEEFYGFEDYRAQISYNGHVTYNFKSVVEILCPIKVEKFPYDSQICTFTLASWSYHGHLLNVSSKWNQVDLSHIKENVEWIVTKSPGVRHEIYYGCCPEPYPDVTFYIHLTRKPDYYITNIIIPSILVTLVAALGFFLPADSGEKIGLELTVMLAMSVFQLLIADHLPPSADEKPWISSFITLTLFLSSGASVWQVFVLNIHYRGNREMPAWLKFYMLKILGFLSFVSLPKEKSTNMYKAKSHYKQDKNLSRIFVILNENRKLKEVVEGHACITSEPDPEETDDTELWKCLALMLDRIGLVIFTSTLAVGTGRCFFAMQHS